MARPKQPLEPRYGKLTVLAELPNSRVQVRCTCGTEKVVHRSNLRAGRVTTCGANTCRPLPLAGPRARGPAWIKHDLIPDLWKRYSSGEAAVNDVAEYYSVHPQTVYALLRNIGEQGINEYMARLDAQPAPRKAAEPEEDYEPPAPARTQLPAPVAGTAAPPPERWIPRGKSA